ncbi:I22R2 protein, partial [Amia calva]|nr:I22R2 protein [Amia calva]
MFRSIDYKNVLHWKPGKGIYNGKAVYFVQHKIYGEKQWTNATHCLGITKMSCDLSQETSDRREFYYARVQAALSGVHSPWVLSQRFVPQWETFFSPPKVKLAAKERSILVHLRPPHSPYRRRKGGWISMKKLHKFNYRIYVSHGNITMVSDTVKCFYQGLQHAEHDNLAEESVREK